MLGESAFAELLPGMWKAYLRGFEIGSTYAATV